MAWRKPNEEDLVSLLSQKEADTFRQSAEMASDPVQRNIENTVEFVRGHIRASGARLGPAGTLPDSLVIPAICYLRFNFMTRHGLKVGDDRKEAYKDALAIFKDVANGKLAVEPPEEESAGRSSPLSPASAPATPARLLD